jgi:hypothetical protein
MRKIILLSICLFAFLWVKSQSLSPEVISTAGDYFVGTNASVSWTLGETVIETYTSSGTILTQGFQQLSYTIVSIDEPPISKNANNGHINVYPNPATDFINVDFIDITHSGVMAQMYDLQGKKMMEEQMQTNPAHRQLDLSKIAKGSYILRFTDPNGIFIKSFKVVKN